MQALDDAIGLRCSCSISALATAHRVPVWRTAVAVVLGAPGIGFGDI
jgi:hypothetical protein